MFNPAARVKDAVHKHKTKLVYGAGVATGVGAMILVKRNFPQHVIAPIPADVLQHLLDDTGPADYVDPKTLIRFTLFNEAHQA